MVGNPPAAPLATPKELLLESIAIQQACERLYERAELTYGSAHLALDWISRTNAQALDLVDMLAEVSAAWRTVKR